LKAEVPHLIHYQITDGPDLEQLLKALQDSGVFIHLTFAPHTCDSSDQTVLPWSNVLSLGIADRDGMRRVEFWNEVEEEYNLRFRGQYNPDSRKGTGSVERVRKPTEPTPPVPPLTGEQVNELFRQSA
jgi:hypothetical protein